MLRVLREGRGGQRVARLCDIQVQATYWTFVTWQPREVTGPPLRSLACDHQHNSALVQTPDAWLNAAGDVAAASTAIYFHPNTSRYRNLALGGRKHR